MLGYTHRGQRSRESKEFREAKRWCLANSFYDSKKNEKIYLGTEDDTVADVNDVLKEDMRFPEFIPDTPQGLILEDNYGTGAFQ